MSTIHLIYKGHYFTKYGNALSAEFIKAGHKVIRFNEDIYEVPELEADLHIVIAPNLYNHSTISKLKGIRVAILTEQLPHIGYPPSCFVIDRLQQFVRHKDVYNLYVEWSEMNGEFLKVHFPELNVAVFPHGFIDSGLVHLVTSQCEWDICFFGAMSSRREDLLNELKKTGIRIFPRHEDVWGPEKYEAMQKSVMVLNMHFAESPPSFEAHRIFDIISVGRPIITEKMNAVPIGLLDNGLRQFMFRYDELLAGIFTSLKRPCETLDTVGTSLRFAAEHKYPMSRLVDIVLLQAAKPSTELEVY